MHHAIKALSVSNVTFFAVQDTIIVQLPIFIRRICAYCVDFWEKCSENINCVVGRREHLEEKTAAGKCLRRKQIEIIP